MNTDVHEKGDVHNHVNIAALKALQDLPHVSQRYFDGAIYMISFPKSELHGKFIVSRIEHGRNEFHFAGLNEVKRITGWDDRKMSVYFGQ